MNSLFASLWQTILRWAYALLGGTATSEPAASTPPPEPEVVVAKREAQVAGAMAQAEAASPRTDAELEASLKRGDF